MERVMQKLKIRISSHDSVVYIFKRFKLYDMKHIFKILVIALAIIVGFSQLSEARVKTKKSTHKTIRVNSKAVSELKSLLSKSNGMRFGTSKMMLTSAKYIDSQNVVEFRFTQHIFPKSEADDALLNDIADACITARKKALRSSSALIRAMQPLHPIIRDILYYPDGTECLRYTYSFNDLYVD